jgi:putative Mn2+ efflux pump MntP
LAKKAIPTNKAIKPISFRIVKTPFLTPSSDTFLGVTSSTFIDLKCLIGLGVATSVDALISGASLRLTHTVLWLACLIIGSGSFIMSLTGFWTGNFISNIRPKLLHISGGLILIALAIKSLL